MVTVYLKEARIVVRLVKIMSKQDKKVFTLLSLLLAYPDDPRPSIDRLRLIVCEVESLQVQNYMYSFLDYMENKPWDELAQHYVATFDFSERSTMDLTALLFPDDRKRGALLANLKSIYRRAGLDVDSGELPDYLPLILEFLSIADEETSAEILGIVRPGMEKLWQQLEKDSSPYAGVVEACLLSTGSMPARQTTPEEDVV